MFFVVDIRGIFQMQQIFNKDQAEDIKLLHFYVWKSLMACLESATLGETSDRHTGGGSKN